MPGLFDFHNEELYTFFAVLVRYSVLFSVLPFVGDKVVPTPVKILLSLAVSIALFPALIARGSIHPADAAVWSATASGIMGTIALEVIFGLIMGFTAKMAFDSINFGANLVGNFMGFAAASTYDPHQEAQTQVVAELQLAFAMLIFLAVDGHHLMLRASLDSFRIVGIGGAGAIFTQGHAGMVGQRLIELGSQVIRFGVLIASPVAISMFAVNVVFGVVAKALPQTNILVLSFAVTALVGLTVMFLGMPEFLGATENIFGRMGDSMELVMSAIRWGK